MKPVYSVNLFPRQNVHVREHPGRDVWDIVQVAVLALLCYVIVWLILV